MQNLQESSHTVFTTHPGYKIHGMDWTGQIRIIPLPHMPEPRITEEQWAQAFKDTPPHLIANGTCSNPLETDAGRAVCDLSAARIAGETVAVRAAAYPNLGRITGMRKPDTSHTLDRAIISWRPTSPENLKYLTVNKRERSLKHRNRFAESEPWLEQPLMGTSLKGNIAVLTDETSAKNGLTHLKWKNVLQRAGIDTLLAQKSLTITGKLNGQKVEYHLSSDIHNQTSMTVQAWCEPPRSPGERYDPGKWLGRAHMAWHPRSAITRLMMLILKDGTEEDIQPSLDEILEKQDPWDWNPQGEWNED